MTVFDYVDYPYFGKCLRAKNDSIEALITVDIGPRVISLKCNGMENIMCEDVNELSTMSGGKFAEVFGSDRKWYLYGGHRLWSSPEDEPRSYYPDNDPVDVKIEGNRVTLTPPPQTEVGLEMQMILDFDENSGDVVVTHKVRNTEDDIKNIAAWAMSVVDKESLAILPQSTKPTGLLPNRTYTVWPYNDMQDDRLYFGNRYITIKQDENCKSNFKLGFNDDNGYIAMYNKGQLFVKRFDYTEGESYPDNGCSCECFTNFFMMELESLSPLRALGKGDEIVHTERWSLIPCSDSFDRKNEQSIIEFMEKNIK